MAALRKLAAPLVLVLAASACISPAPPPATPVEPQVPISPDAVDGGVEGGGWDSAHWRRFVAEGPGEGRLPDFSRAGYRSGTGAIPEVHPRTIDATRFGATPDDGTDDTAAIQSALDEVGRAGGGLVTLPAGRFDVHATEQAPFLAIRHPRVVLRGAGQEVGGTLLFLGARAPYDGKTSLPRPGDKLGSDPRRFAAVAILGPEGGEVIGQYTAPLRRGEDLITVDSTAAMAPGQLVRLLLSSVGADPALSLPAQLTAPFRLAPELTVTQGAHGQGISWLVEVAEVRDGTRARLAQPARLDQPLSYAPRLQRFPGIEGAAIERLRIESAWPGGYAHHKPFPWDAAAGAVVRSTAEQDYLWVGIWVSQAHNGWIREVTIVNCTQGIRLAQVAHFTVDRVRQEGLDAHHGVHLARSHGVLVRDYEAYARIVHPVSVESWASGNVFLRARCAYESTDERTSTGPHIDFHGLFPYENLFDGLRGCYPKPGGDREVMPHAGVRNTFWNIEMPSLLNFREPRYAQGEFFRTPNFDLAMRPVPAGAHEHWPQSFVIGTHRAGGLPVVVAGEAGDRADQWLTVEGNGREGVRPASLYEAQLARRRGHP